MTDKISKLHYWVAITSTPGIGSKTFFNLLKSFNTAENIWNSSGKDFELKNIPQRIHKLISKRKSNTDPLEYYQSIIKKNIEVLAYFQDDFPSGLKTISSPPPVIYIKGRIKASDANALAVVGTRKPSLYGRRVTQRIVKDLSDQKITIISGLARGIDAIAHKTAIDNNNRTIAFLAGGIDIIYPASHRGLAEQIIQNGCIVSEYAPGILSNKGSFPSRNRLISAMSKGVLVVEGLSKSGTVHTAKHAMNQNKPIFAVPGQITSSLSDAPMDLINQGAIMVRGAEDILNNLNIKKNKLGSKKRKPKFDNKSQEKIYKCLLMQGLDANQIIKKTKLSTIDVLTCLSVMEIKGYIKNISGIYLIE